MFFIAIYYSQTQFNYKNKLLEILESILGFKYNFDYTNIQDAEFNSNFLLKKDIWEKIYPKQASQINMDEFIRKYEELNNKLLRSKKRLNTDLLGY